MKKNKLKSIEGIDISCFECVYSPAKRRGPVPGKMGQVRKAPEPMHDSSSYNNVVASTVNGNAAAAAAAVFGGGIGGAVPGLDGGFVGASADEQQQQLLALQQRQMMLAAAGTGNANLLGLGGALGAATGEVPSMFENAAGLTQQQQAIQQQLNYLQQLHAQQQLSAIQTTSGGSAEPMDTSTTTLSSSSSQPQSQKLQTERSSKMQRNASPVSAAAELEDKKAITVQKNLPLLSLDSTYGNRLRSYYHLSVDELFGLPHIPSDEDYVKSLNGAGGGMTAKTLSQSHKSALQAAQFAEIALGALVHNEVSLAMELSNASVSRLKQCIVMEGANRKFLFEVARAYFLLGCFRAFRGDMERYLKYRRVCMQHLSQIEDSESDEGPQLLVAAISYLDCWSYMVHNADEKKLPSIDDSIPRLEDGISGQTSSAAEKEYGVCFATNKIVSDPKNQNWMQGAPPIFLNNEAPLNARSLDALSFAFRSCCDQANGRFEQMAEAVAAEQGNGDAASAQAASGGGDVSSSQEITATTSAVMAHENELCSRNMVLSAFTLLQQYESATTMPNKNQGLHLIISAMDAFLENGEEDESGGFTDSQIQSLLSVCNTTIENPFLLHHGGPTYHMISNAAILLCHLLNGMHAMRASPNGAGSSSDDGDHAMEVAVFEEVYDTFISVRKLLNIHRRKLPVKLRCHGIPRPSMDGTVAPDKPFIDLGETLMCGCRGCQGFVLMACSPCVAAERARSANRKREIEVNREGGEDQVELDKELNYLEAEFDLDDDALLNMLSRIISN